MSDFDAQDVLRKVDENQIPTDWKVYGARKSYFYQQGFIFAFLALGTGYVFAMTSVILVVSVVHDQAVISDPLRLYDGLLLTSLPAFSLLFTITAIWWAITQFSQLRTVGTHVFVLTPEGCVARTGSKPYQTYGVAYAQVAAITMSVYHARFEPNIALILMYTPGSDGHQRREQWRINLQFKASDAIAQAIIEAHTRYTVTHAPATAR